jgi:hypothetical protein
MYLTQTKEEKHEKQQVPSTRQNKRPWRVHYRFYRNLTQEECMGDKELITGEAGKALACAGGPALAGATIGLVCGGPAGAAVGAGLGVAVGGAIYAIQALSDSGGRR